MATYAYGKNSIESFVNDFFLRLDLPMEQLREETIPNNCR